MGAVIPLWSWLDRAACRSADPDLFFGPDDETRAERTRRERGAALVCASCPVRGECDAAATATRSRYGVWGGAGETSRRAVRRSRRKAS